MTALWRVIHDFWRRPVRAEPLALFRIALGTTLFLSLLALLPDLDHFLRLCPSDALGSWPGKTTRICILHAPVDSPFFTLPASWVERWNALGDNRVVIYALFALWLLSTATLTAGFYTRTSAVLAWLLATSFQNRLVWTINGGDGLCRVGLFCLVLAPAGAVWSIDYWRARRRTAADDAGPVFIPPWSVRLIQIQLCMVYFFTGLAKVGSDWNNGQALYWVLNDIAVMRWPYHRLPLPMGLLKLATWTTLAWEIGFPVLILFRRLRPWVLGLGVALHLGILVMMEVGWFSQITLCWYAVFLPGDRLAALARRFSTSQWRAGDVSPPVQHCTGGLTSPAHQS
jgi:hypothetical protein